MLVVAVPGPVGRPNAHHGTSPSMASSLSHVLEREAERVNAPFGSVVVSNRSSSGLHQSLRGARNCSWSKSSASRRSRAATCCCGRTSGFVRGHRQPDARLRRRAPRKKRLDRSQASFEWVTSVRVTERDHPERRGQAERFGNDVDLSGPSGNRPCEPAVVACFEHLSIELRRLANPDDDGRPYNRLAVGVKDFTFDLCGAYLPPQPQDSPARRLFSPGVPRDAHRSHRRRCDREGCDSDDKKMLPGRR